MLGRSETSQYIGKPAFSKFLYDKPGAQNVIDPSGRRGNEPLDIYLERLLCENQETRETIGTKITNPRLFYCQTTVEIDRLFPQHYEDNPSAPVPKDDLIILPFGDKPTDELLMDKEIEVANTSDDALSKDVMPYLSGKFRHGPVPPMLRPAWSDRENYPDCSIP